MTSYIIFILFLALIRSVLVLVTNRQSVPINLPAPIEALSSKSPAQEGIKTNSAQVMQRAFRSSSMAKHHISTNRVTPVPVESTPEQNTNRASIFITPQLHSEEDAPTPLERDHGCSSQATLLRT